MTTPTLDVTALQAKVDANIAAYQAILEQGAKANLLLIAAEILAVHPDAVRIWVSETDQDMSGSLVPGDIDVADIEGNTESVSSDDLHDELWGPCSNLDDRNQDTWGDFFEGTYSESDGTAGYLDLAKIVDGLGWQAGAMLDPDLATTPADDGRPAVVRRHYAVVLEDAVSFAIPAGIDVTNPAVDKAQLFDQLYRLAKGAAPHEVGLPAAMALAFNPAIAWEDEYQADVDSFDDTYEISYEPEKEAKDG